MARSGEINSKFGVYASQCCQHEITIREGATFPECPGHPGIATAWEWIEAEIVDVKVIRKGDKSDPAA
jgi:hypothetical protein